MAERIVYFNLKTPSVIRHSQLAGFRRYATARGWDVAAVPEDRSRPELVPGLLKRYGAAGAAVDCTGMSCDLPPELFSGLPVVYLGVHSSAYGDAAARIAVDDSSVARAAFRELAAGRPRAFAAVGFNGETEWSRERVGAFAKLARASGAPFRALPPRRNEPRGEWVRRLAKWLARLPRGAAVYAVSDHVAAAVAGAARIASLRIPRDFTLVGSDDIAKICERCRPRLSSVRIDYDRTGFRAARMLDALIDGRSGPPPAERIAPLLVVRRESTRGSGRTEAAVLSAVETIRREACDGLTAAALASRVPGSRRLFEIRFREATGHSVLDEIHQVRLEKVQTLLARPDMPISSIADFCGFKSYHVLHRLFKARTGMTMLRWRKQHFG